MQSQCIPVSSVNVTVRDSVEVLVVGRELVRSGTARAVRQELGLSTLDIARAVDVTVSTVSLWERGLRVPRGKRGDDYVRLIHHLVYRTVPLVSGTATSTSNEARP